MRKFLVLNLLVGGSFLLLQAVGSPDPTAPPDLGPTAVVWHVTTGGTPTSGLGGVRVVRPMGSPAPSPTSLQTSPAHMPTASRTALPTPPAGARRPAFVTKEEFIQYAGQERVLQMQILERLEQIEKALDEGK